MEGQSPLYHATHSGKIESVVALIAAGAKCNHRDKHGRTLLHAAAGFDNRTNARRRTSPNDETACTPTLSRYEISARERNLGKGLELLHTTATEERDVTQIREIVRVLIREGADPALIDHEEHTATDVALMLGVREVVEELAHAMQAIYNSIPAKLAPLDPFHETMVPSRRVAATKCLQQLDFSKNRVPMIERLFSSGDGELVKELLPLNVPFIEEDGDSALHLAVRYGYTSLVAMTLPHIADVNKIQPPILHTCVDREINNIAMLRLLIKAGANVNAVRKPSTIENDAYNSPWLFDRGKAAIHKLALGTYHWYPEALEVLLDGGADIEKETCEGVTPLEQVLSRRSATPHYSPTSDPGYWSGDILEILLKHGADVNKTSSKGTTPLKQAISNKRGKAVIQKLIDHGLELVMGGGEALISAVEEYDIDMVKMLLEAGTDPNFINKSDKDIKSRLTPLLRASTSAKARSGFRDCPEDQLMNYGGVCAIMDLLTAYVGNPRLRLDDGSTTVLHEIAAERGIITASLLKDFDLGERDAKGRTILHRICDPSNGWQSIHDTQSFTTLIEAGSDLNAQDSEGDTPLHYALRSNKIRKAELLLAHGASITMKNNKGFAPLQSTFKAFGCYLGHAGANRETMELLLKASAHPQERGQNGTTIFHHMMSGLMEYNTIMQNGYYDDEDNIKEFNGLKELYTILIAQGCNMEAEDDNGVTPIFHFVATTKSYSEVACCSPPNPAHVREMFAQHDIFHVNHDGDGLLHVAAGREESWDGNDGKDGLRLWEMLVEMGLDPRLENKKRITPLDVAAACDNELILELYARKD